jgi:hypothetical protein
VIEGVEFIFQIVDQLGEILAPLGVEFAVGVGEVDEEEVGVIEVLFPVDGVPHGGVIWPALEKYDEVAGLLVTLFHVL